MLKKRDLEVQFSLFFYFVEGLENHDFFVKKCKYEKKYEMCCEQFIE